jgi:hypothetical protein
MALDSGGGAAAATGGAQGADAVTDAMCDEAEEGGGGAEAAGYALPWAADGLASTRAEKVPTLVLRETCGGGRRERRRDHVHADDGIAVRVVRLITVLGVLVMLRVCSSVATSRASERVEGEASMTP